MAKLEEYLLFKVFSFLFSHVVDYAENLAP